MLKIVKTIQAVLLLGVIATCAFAQGPGTQTIGGVSYLSLGALSKQNSFEFSWDPLLKNALIKSGKNSVKFHAGSEYVLVNGTLEKLSGKVLFYGGEALAPVSASRFFDDLKVRPAALVSTVAPAQIPLKRIRKIIVDAGHGGKDFGAVSKRGTVEKEVVLDIAGALKGELQKLGFEVMMTRTDDRFITLQDRAKMPAEKNADLFISVHANAALEKSLQGFEVYYLSEATDDTALALERAENASIRFEKGLEMEAKSSVKAIYWDLKQTENRRESMLMAETIADSVERNTEISKKRIRSAGFYVLKWTESPAVLIELGYITNAQDERRLKDLAYRVEIAHSIAQGILNYAKEYEKTDGFTR